MEKIRKGDEVIVLTGRDKARGVVPRWPDHVWSKASMSSETLRQPHGRYPRRHHRQTMPSHFNVALYNPATGKGDRVIRFDGKKSVFRSNGAVVGAKHGA